MESKKGNLIIGIAIVLVGILLFLRALGILKIPSFNLLTIIWPLAIILVGVALLFKSKGVIIYVIVALIIAVILLSGEIISTPTAERLVIKDVADDSDIQTLNVKLNYGAGQVNINDDQSRQLVKFIDLTTSIDDPTFNYEKIQNNNGNDKNSNISTNSYANLYLSRASQNFRIGDNKDEWNVSFSKDVILNLDMDYGASEMNFDLSNLKVDYLKINNGVSDTNIKFGNYPSKVDIETGMSSYVLSFPKNVGVIITMESGMCSTSFLEFTKQQNDDEIRYVNGYYNENSTNNIEITIHAGMSDFKTETY